jgi:hypothetical protein
MKDQINFEEITLRCKVSPRGGGIEISLDTLGFKGVKMSAYQNYLGGGMLGRVCSDCTVRDWQDSEVLQGIAVQLMQYFHTLTNPEEGEWESLSFEQNQGLSESAY